MFAKVKKGSQLADNREKVRDSGIELLRIFAIFGVVFIHVSDRALSELVDIGGCNLHFVILLRSFFAFSVDVFLVISGYYLCKNNNRTIGKPFDLVWQVCIYQACFYIILIIWGREPFGLSHIFVAAVPDSYYTTLFVVVYLISPYLNRLFASFNKQEMKRHIIVLVLIFSIVSTICTSFCEITNRTWMGISPVGAWGSQQGFNVVNFLLCYCLGAYLRLFGLPDKLIKNRSLIIILFVTTVVIFIWAEVNQLFPMFGMRSAWVYDNPLVILQAIVFFLISKNIHFNSKIINNVSKAVYPTFLIHCILIWYVDIEEWCHFSWYLLFIYYLLFTIGSYFISYLVYWLYRCIFGSMIRKIDNKQILYFGNRL